MFKIYNKNTGSKFYTDGKASILAEALANNFKFPYGCTKGACANCKALILEGSVIYKKGKPKALSSQDKKDGYALLCQCFATSNIVLTVDEGI